MQHKLKILPQYFKEVVRKKDRDYKVGDTLLLKEYSPLKVDTAVIEYNLGAYTGQEITKEVTYIYEGEDCGLKKGWCVLGLKDIEVISDKEKQEFQLGDTAYCIDEDYRFFESTVYRIELNKEKYFYTSGDADFEFKDIGDWVFTSEIYREIHLENKIEIGEQNK